MSTETNDGDCDVEAFAFTREQAIQVLTKGQMADMLDVYTETIEKLRQAWESAATDEMDLASFFDEVDIILSDHDAEFAMTRPTAVVNQHVDGTIEVTVMSGWREG